MLLSKEMWFRFRKEQANRNKQNKGKVRKRRDKGKDKQYEFFDPQRDHLLLLSLSKYFLSSIQINSSYQSGAIKPSPLQQESKRSMRKTRDHEQKQKIEALVVYIPQLLFQIDSSK